MEEILNETEPKKRGRPAKKEATAISSEEAQDIRSELRGLNSTVDLLVQERTSQKIIQGKASALTSGVKNQRFADSDYCYKMWDEKYHKEEDAKVVYLPCPYEWDESKIRSRYNELHHRSITDGVDKLRFKPHQEK